MWHSRFQAYSTQFLIITLDFANHFVTSMYGEQRDQITDMNRNRWIYRGSQMTGGALAPSSFLNYILFDALSSPAWFLYNSSFPKAGPTCQSSSKEVGPHGSWSQGNVGVFFFLKENRRGAPLLCFYWKKNRGCSYIGGSGNKEVTKKICKITHMHLAIGKT